MIEIIIKKSCKLTPFLEVSSEKNHRQHLHKWICHHNKLSTYMSIPQKTISLEQVNFFRVERLKNGLVNITIIIGTEKKRTS